MKSLKDLRIDSRLSQEKVALKVGIRTQQYFKYEKGLQVPNVVMAYKIAKAIGVSTDDIALCFSKDN